MSVWIIKKYAYWWLITDILDSGIFHWDKNKTINPFCHKSNTLNTSVMAEDVWDAWGVYSRKHLGGSETIWKWFSILWSTLMSAEVGMQILPNAFTQSIFSFQGVGFTFTFWLFAWNSISMSFGFNASRSRRKMSSGF